MTANTESSTGVLEERRDVVEINLDGREISMKTHNGDNSTINSLQNEDDEYRLKDGDSTVTSKSTKKDLTIRFKDWGFKVDRLFEVAYRFYKRNESKAFHPTFDERNHMNALILQAKYGNFDGARAPDVGVLDLVGKSRRNEWSLLKGMSKTEAMSKFICTLDEICPIFKAYAEAVKLSTSNPQQSAQQNRTSPDGTRNIVRNSTEFQLYQSQHQQQTTSDDADQLQENREQLKAIRASLCKQTYSQFKTYAEKQIPNDLMQQKYLINSLQEQYYQQYISQMHPEMANATNSNQDNESLMSVETSHTSSVSNSSIKSPALSPNLSIKSASCKTNPAEPASNHQPQAHTTIDLSGNAEYSMQPTPSEPIEISKRIEQQQQKSLNIDLERNIHNQSYPAPPQPRPQEKVQQDQVPPHLREAQQQQQQQVKNQTYQQTPVIPAFEPSPPPVPIQKTPISAPQPFNYSQVAEPPKTSSPALPIPMQDLPPPQMLPDVLPPKPRQESGQTMQSTEPQRQIDNIKSRQEPNPKEIVETVDGQPQMKTEPTDIKQEQRQVDTWSCGSSSGACSPLNQSFSYEPLEPASIWTKKGLQEFKESLVDDKHSGAYVVKQGILLTIQVPTYPDGRYIHFEFATDDFDIGFGLDFIYESNLLEPLAIRIQEESDDDDDEEPFEEDQVHQAGGGGLPEVDIESSHRPVVVNEQLGRKRAERLEREARTVSIVPTYRRDSHEEVFVGRHRYPGQGYYLLKFDNTYSVLRSKSLFFRICYFI